MPVFNPALLSLVAGLGTWGVTAAGSSLVFFLRRIKTPPFEKIMGFAAGVMIAASFFSLILPAIAYTEKAGQSPSLPVLSGLIAGYLIMRLLTRYEEKRLQTEHAGFRLLFSAMLMHNIPEGLAVGVAFGVAAETQHYGPALALAIGIAIQNFPEGAAVSLPARQAGYSAFRAFSLGHLSALVEPPAAVAGALLSGFALELLPYLMSFAAGAMIFASFALLTSCRGGAARATSFATLGFICMSLLDMLL